jgi:hypothetical protein
MAVSESGCAVNSYRSYVTMIRDQMPGTPGIVVLIIVATGRNCSANTLGESAE